MSRPQRLSVRRGLQQAGVLIEGVPTHAKSVLTHWLEGEFGYRSSTGMRDQVMMRVAMICELPFRRTYDANENMMSIFLPAARDDDVFLDVLDATLQVRDRQADAETLRQILLEAGSAWTVAKDGRGLERAADAATTASFRAATLPGDQASIELEEAWANAYGRSPNPSDAWDHAIKAVEDVLVPIVTPTNPKATLGAVLAEMKSNPSARALALATSSKNHTGVETLEEMLRLIWPNPDRHGGNKKRIPTVEEARAVLQIAITVVQLVRSGLLT